MNLVQRLVGRHVDSGHGDRISYVDPELGEVSYAWLYRAVRAYAAALQDAGVHPGSRGLVLSDDCVAAVVAILGLWWHGSVPVPVSPMLRESEIIYIAKDCSAGFAHLDASAATNAAIREALGALPQLDGERLRTAWRCGAPGAIAGAADPGAPVDLPASSEALIQYTSGSTGLARGVRHGTRGIDAVLGGFGSVLALNSDDIVLSTAKLSFGYGFGNSLLFPLAAGARAVLLNGPADPYRVAAALRRHQPSVLCSVPRAYAGLLELARSKQDALDMGCLRLGVSAGEHLPAQLSRQLAEAFGFPLINGLGATEVLHIVIATPPQEPANGSTGYPVPGVTVTVRDDVGRPVPDGHIGRLHVRAASAAPGYIGHPKTAGRVFADGGAYTGDIVCRTADGDIRYVCRADDMLNIGGFKVSPLEIETVLRATHGVADCAVVGEADGASLEQAVAYVVPGGDADREELRKTIRRSLRAELAPYKRPARIEVIDALPTTSTGKLARFKLRASLEPQ